VSRDGRRQGSATPRWLASALRWSADALPIVSLVLLAGLVAALVMLAERQDREDRRLDLVRDALWVSEALDFALGAQREAIERLAVDTARAGLRGEEFLTRARPLVTAYAELVAVSLVDAEGRVIDGWPRNGEVAAPSPATVAAARAVAQASGRAATTGVMRAPGGGAVVGVVAIADGGQAVVALLSLDKLLAQQAPWWVAEKHAVAIVDADDAPLATRARTVADAGIAPYRMAFGEASQGLFVKLSAYRRPTNLARNALLGAIGALALLTAVSLWARARHLRRRREAELRLRDEYAFRRAMEDSLTVGMRARDLDGRITSVNPAFCRMVGWSQQELVGRAPPMPYWREEDIERTRAFHDSVLEGRAPKHGMELRFRRRDGVEFDALVYEAPLIDAQGRQKGWIGSFVDVTARKQAEALAREQSETLERTARLVTIGEMASLVAHELNQPLAAISSYTAGMLNLVEAGAADEAAMRGALSKSAEAARRAGRIIQRVQDFVRRSEPRHEPFDLAGLARECVEFFQRDAGDVAVTLDVAADAPQALGDRVLIEQVIINLLRNAAEATDAQAERRIAARLAAEDGHLVFSVADNGPGLSPEIEARLFTPFATTKRNGMGLGLTICRSILEVHRGRLTGANAPGGGAVFAFRLRAAGASQDSTQGRAVA